MWAHLHVRKKLENDIHVALSSGLPPFFPWHKSRIYKICTEFALKHQYPWSGWPKHYQSMGAVSNLFIKWMHFLFWFFLSLEPIPLLNKWDASSDWYHLVSVYGRLLLRWEGWEIGYAGVYLFLVTWVRSFFLQFSVWCSRFEIFTSWRYN